MLYQIPDCALEQIFNVFHKSNNSSIEFESLIVLMKKILTEFRMESQAESQTEFWAEIPAEIHSEYWTEFWIESWIGPRIELLTEYSRLFIIKHFFYWISNKLSDIPQNQFLNQISNQRPRELQHKTLYNPF